jgi:hypothetical protein
MAVSKRATAAALAGVTLAAVVAAPASAFWRASGSGTGTVPTATGAPKVITLTLASANGQRIRATGSAGLSAAFDPAVTVVLCKVNTWPCPDASIAAKLTATAAAGTPSYSVTSTNNLNGVTVYGLAQQRQTSGWTDYSTVFGPMTG